MLLPERFRDPAREVMDRILARYRSTLAFAVIGSVAEGTYGERSDLDLVWVTKGRFRIRYWRFIELPEDPRVEIVFLPKPSVEDHFRYCSTMAHSLKRSIILYDPNGYLEGLKGRELGLPSKEWMRRWFEHWRLLNRFGLESLLRERRFHRKHCEGACFCSVDDTLARVAVNYAILFVECHRTVPTNKEALWLSFCDLVEDPEKRRIFHNALQVHRERRWMGLEEAMDLVKLIRWLRSELKAMLLRSEGGS
jgi:predicted nucleotidyltransferase